MREVYYFSLFILTGFGLLAQSNSDKGVGQNSPMAIKVSVLSGNWTTGATWGGTSPAGSDNINVLTAVTVNTNLAITGTLTVGATGTLIDAAGGSNYTLDITGSGLLDVYNTTTFGGAVTLQNTGLIHVHGCSTLTTGTMNLQNNSNMIVDACATVVINGDLIVENSNAMTIDGTIIVNGNVVGKNNATSSGTGSLSATGTITTQNGSDFFGFTGNCSTAPCLVNSSGMGTGLLPVELTEFSATANAGGVDLKWVTANEHNNSYFSIERGLNGVDFEEITKVMTKATGGNSSEQLNYSFTDTDPIVGGSYYRLKQTDADGKFEYFSVISVDYLPAVDVKFTVFPNPNSGEFYVDFSGIENNHEVEIFLHGANGKTLFSTKFYVQDSKNENIKITPSEKLNPGIYFCSLVSEGIRTSVKVIVN